MCLDVLLPQNALPFSFLLFSQSQSMTECETSVTLRDSSKDLLGKSIFKFCMINSVELILIEDIPLC